MTYWSVKNIQEAYAYILDCNLATLEGLSLKKNPPRKETQRQLNLTQIILDKAIEFNIDLKADLKATTGQYIIEKHNKQVMAFFEQDYRLYHNILLQNKFKITPLEQPLNTIEDTFKYIMDCNLQTIEEQAMKKKPYKEENKLEKHIKDFECMIEWSKEFNIEIDNPKIKLIINKFNSKVKEYTSSLYTTQLKQQHKQML